MSELPYESRLDYRRALNLDADRGQCGRGRAGYDRAVGDAELTAVARAVDGATGHAGDGAALVGAYRGERLERAGPRLGDHDLLVGQDLAATHRDVGDQSQ